MGSHIILLGNRFVSSLGALQLTQGMHVFSSPAVERDGTKIGLLDPMLPLGALSENHKWNLPCGKK